MLKYEFIIVIFEAYIYISFLKFFIEREISHRWLAFVYVVSILGMVGYRLWDDNTVLFFALSIGGITAFTALFGVRFKKALMLGIFVSFASFISREVSSLFMEATYNQTIFNIDREADLYLTGSMVSKLILFIILRSVIRGVSMHDRTLPLIQWVATMLIPALSVYAVHEINTITDKFRSDGGIYSFVFLVWLAVINVLSFILYDGFAKQSKISLEEKQEKIRLEAENSRYIKMISYADDVRSFMHDIQEHLKNILSLTETNEPKEVAEYIRNLNIKVADMYEQSILSQYPAVDTVLRQKTVEARIRGIALECNITVPSGMPIKPIDLCIILGNALDNAIEACSKLGSDTKITLEMFLTKNRLSIKITNPSVPVNIDGNKCETTKEDSTRHGYGMRNIESTIEKYHGNMLINYDDGYFCMIVLILF